MDERPSMLRQLAHELRDALSPMRSAVDLLRLRGFDAETARRTADKVERGVDYALAAIDAFVIAEQCESGHMEIAPEECTLGQLAGAARDTLAGLFAGRSQRCQLSPAEPGGAVRADPAKSRQILTSMLEHASAAAPPEALIELEVEEASPTVRVRFALQPGARAAAFDDFHSRARGSRMALRSARQIMQLQGGELEARERDGAAELIATFVAAGAAAAAPAPKAAPPASGEGPGRHILIVDDSTEVRSVYKEALVALGYAVTEAANAEEALATAAQACPEVALIDIHLPGMNGYRLAKALRARTVGPLRLVMLSGMTLDDTTVRLSREAGFDECIDKAAGPKALHRLLQAGAA